MLVLVGSAIACIIAALSIRTLRRSIARFLLGLAAIFFTILWFDQTCDFSQEWRYGIGSLILLGLGLLAWLVRLPSINPKKIEIALAHAQNLHYGGATYADHLQTIIPTKPIQLEYIKKDNVLLCFGIDKGEENDGIPLSNVRLHLTVKENSGISIRIQPTVVPDDNPYHVWKLYRPNECFYQFEHPINQRGVHTWSCLFLTFPSEGDHELKFTITAEGIKEQIRSVTVKVHLKAQ